MTIDIVVVPTDRMIGADDVPEAVEDAFTVIVDEASVAVGITVTNVVVEATESVYESVDDEKAGAKTPEETERPDNEAIDEDAVVVPVPPPVDVAADMITGLLVATAV